MKKQFQILTTTIFTIAIVSCSKQGIEKPNTVQSAVEEISTSSSSSSRIDPLLANLEGWFTFDNNLKDKAAKLADAIPTTRGVIYAKDRKGNVKSAIYFDSTYGLKIKNVPQQTHTSISLWFKPSSTVQLSTHIAGSSYYGPKVFHASNKVGGAVSVGSNTPGAWAGDINTFNWYHIVVTYDGSYVKVYLNNVLKVNMKFDGTIPSTLNDYFLGFEPDWYFWKGYVDDIRFYSRTLSASDVQNLYNL